MTSSPHVVVSGQKLEHSKLRRLANRKLEFFVRVEVDDTAQHTNPAEGRELRWDEELPLCVSHIPRSFVC